MHQEVITSKARKVFDKLKNFPDFYLAGGTGLAFQLGHRISVDFDLFWEKDIPKTLFFKVEDVFADAKVELIVNRLEQLTVLIEGVSISFIKYPFPMFSQYNEYLGVKIVPVAEIAAMKAYALGRRATLKDYIDLYFIVRDKLVTLKEIIVLGKKRYGQEFDPRLFLEQLIYSKDVEQMEIRFLRKEVSKSEIEDFFRREIKKIRV